MDVAQVKAAARLLDAGEVKIGHIESIKARPNGYLVDSTICGMKIDADASHAIMIAMVQQGWRQFNAIVEELDAIGVDLKGWQDEARAKV